MIEWLKQILLWLKHFPFSVKNFYPTKEDIDWVYSERNKVVAAMAFMAKRLGYKAGLKQHEGEWEDDWRTIIFVDLPTGQVSWYFHDSEEKLLFGLPDYDGEYDGHSTELKYKRLDSYE